MTYQRGIITGILSASLVLGAIFVGWWLVIRPVPETKKSTSPPIPANVVANEGQFNTITLTEAAEKTLKLKFGKVGSEAMRRCRLYGGEVIIPPGQTIIVSAPFSGVLETASKTLPEAGSRVNRGTPIFKLFPLLTPDGRANLAAAKIDADGQVRNAEAQLALADKNLTRARMLLQDDVGSKQRVDDAEAAQHIAQRTLDAVKKRSELLAKVAGDADGGTSAPIAIEAPANGLLRNVTVAHGQNVPVGAVLFEVADLSSVWVRVPIYVRDLAEIDERAAGIVGSLTPRPREKGQIAKRVEAPPSANPQAGTVDFFFKVDNSQTKYSPGQRVGVTIPLTGQTEYLTIPWAALLYDINGGTWVYVKTGEHSYMRRRVVVQQVKDNTVYLTGGPPQGTDVVTDGAIELFGTETGFSK